MLAQFMTDFAAFLWGWPLIIVMIGTGIIYTISSKGFQFRFFGYSLHQTYGKVIRKEEQKGQEGVLTAYEAISIAIGGTVGVGNIGGVATAIAVGGPGAVFWMWIASLLGMMIKMVEVTLAVHYRTRDEENKPFGGPMYYIKNGIGKDKKMPGLAGVLNFLFIFCMIAGMGITMQCYNVSESVSTTFNINQSMVAVIYTAIIYGMISGGLKKLGKIASKIVPVMCIMYILAGIVIILLNIGNLGQTIKLIFAGAFNGTAVVGGFSGATVMLALNKGLARAVFSNEAGQGTSPMIHSTATTDHPIRQGMWGVFEVFVDTILVCSLTAISIIITGQWSSGLSGATLTLSAFEASYGSIGKIILTIAIVLFGVTTSTGWYTYYEVVLRYLFGNGKVSLKKLILNIYKWTYPLFGLGLVLYANLNGMPTDIVWNFADVATGVPVMINVFALLMLVPKFIELLNDFKARYMNIGKINPAVKVFYEDKIAGFVNK